MGALRRAPCRRRSRRAVSGLFTLSITDNANPALTVSAQSLVTALDVRVTPANARPSRRVRFRGRGFTGAAPVYAHYLRKGKLRKTVQLATAAGPCGTFDVRRRQLPVHRPQHRALDGPDRPGPPSGARRPTQRVQRSHAHRIDVIAPARGSQSALRTQSHPDALGLAGRGIAR